MSSHEGRQNSVKADVVSFNMHYKFEISSESILSGALTMLYVAVRFSLNQINPRELAIDAAAERL